MMPWAYYNEHDPFAAAWLRELIKDDLIAPGEVDERSIEDVTPDEIRSFRQCHFFAGIGVWSLAARLAGIADDAPLWSGSCPCQPFSQAGQGGGFADERHLWPAFDYLIEQCRPPLVVGEQVAGADGDAWFDLVSADLDAKAYAFGVAETCAAGFGAPHIRARNYWVAIAQGIGRREQLRDFSRSTRSNFATSSRQGNGDALRSDSATLRMADTRREQRERRKTVARPDNQGSSIGNESAVYDQRFGAVGGMAAGQTTRIERPGPTNGLWRNVDWLRCRDEPVPKWRPVESGTFPLANAGAFRNRVGLLRGAGNAITLGQAEGFLRAVMASI